MAILTAGGDGSDELSVEMLGAGQEVGRSCCVLKYKGRSFSSPSALSSADSLAFVFQAKSSCAMPACIRPFKA